MGKADSLEKYDNLIESATMLVLNCQDEKWLPFARVTLNEIIRRKEVALVNGLINFVEIKEKIWKIMITICSSPWINNLFT